MKRTIILIIAFTMLFSIYTITANAEEDDIYNRQREASGADSIYNALPDETRNYLDNIGLDGVLDGKSGSINSDNFFSSLLSVASDAFKSEGIPVLTLFGIILLCALANGMKTSLSQGSMIIDIAGTLCICSAIAVPIAGLIDECGDIITASANFMTIYLPVMAGLMISSGQGISASSYYTLMMAASQGASQICSRIILPLINIFFGISIVSSISPQISLSGICNLFHKSIKWILGFIMSVFASLLTIQTIIGSCSDTVTSKAVRFAVRSFVPVVGGALSDAYTTMQSCVKLLKSGVGIVAMIGTAFIYLPIFFKCLFWLAVLNICSSFSEIFELKTECTLFSSCSKALSSLIAVILSAMALFVISTAIILVVGVQ